MPAEENEIGAERCGDTQGRVVGEGDIVAVENCEAVLTVPVGTANLDRAAQPGDDGLAAREGAEASDAVEVEFPKRWQLGKEPRRVSSPVRSRLAGSGSCVLRDRRVFSVGDEAVGLHYKPEYFGCLPVPALEDVVFPQAVESGVHLNGIELARGEWEPLRGGRPHGIKHACAPVRVAAAAGADQKAPAE